MAALTKTVNVFPKERTIVQQERTKGSYGLIPYLLSKLVAEAPISAAFPLAFAAVVYPMTGLHPTFSRFVQPRVMSLIIDFNFHLQERIQHEWFIFTLLLIHRCFFLIFITHVCSLHMSLP